MERVIRGKKVKEDYINYQSGYTEVGSSEVQPLFDKLIWGIDEVCIFSSYAKGTIYNLVHKGEIPHRTRGRRRRLVFVPSEIAAWIKGEPV